jgi:hypothetical protein
VGWSPDPFELDHVEWCVMALAMSAGLLVYEGQLCTALRAFFVSTFCVMDANDTCPAL